MGARPSCIVPLAEAAGAGDALVGGKAASLGSLVQAVELANRSGVAFGRDPRSPDADRAVVEAVPGPCALLVDGSVDPDRWILTRTLGELVEWRPGRRGSDEEIPLLDARDLEHLLGMLSRIEALFAWPPDVEWTGRAPDTVVLQARPITSTPPDADDERGWYLTLRPNLRRLSALAARVTDELIPALESEGARFAAQDLAECTDAELAAALRDPGAVLDLPGATPDVAKIESVSRDTPRQLIGQPASPGLASGRVCRITAGKDIGRFRAGNVLVCDAIQPMMTHLVPLAAAVVERRGWRAPVVRGTG